MTIVRTAGAFCNKIWQASRFLQMAHDRAREAGMKLALEEVKLNDLRVESQWIRSRCALAVVEVNQHMGNYDFNLVTSAIRRYFYSEICDVYLVSILCILLLNTTLIYYNL